MRALAMKLYVELQGTCEETAVVVEGKFKAGIKGAIPRTSKLV